MLKTKPMKKNYLLVLFCLLTISASSQINPFLGIIDVDSCKFESQCVFLRLDTSIQNNWQIGKPLKPYFDTAYSLPYAIVTDTINPYPISNHSYFDLILPNYYFFNMVVGFKHKFQTDSLIDGGYIDVSYNGGQTWMSILNTDTTAVEFNTENMYSIQDTIKGGINGFSGNSNGWIYSRVQWVWSYQAKSYPPDTVIMRFHFISDSVQTNKAGWMIDDILISYAYMLGSVSENNNNKYEIIIAPNPMENSTQISFPNKIEQNSRLDIINTFGQTVKQFENISSNNIQIEKSSLTSGTYIIRLFNNERIFATKKLIIK